MRIHSSSVFLAAIAVACASAAAAADKSDKQLIENAISAAPKAVGKDAAVVNWEMKTLRKGTNGFTCIPDDPSTPTDDPMCTDKNGMEWMNAYMSKKEPPKGKVAFAYMLKGGSAASNTDPFATKPPEGADWLHDGPHVMVMNAPDIMALYPHEPVVNQPYVMFPDTPYAHLMIPVK
ncbi:hypothetical protein RFM98_19295 [Mesorhizobium sp. VK9D]|uniref:hypothetical protein n=1 Tax=Mesorhizobium australafricanum TaxID=3072311 RepID=UPI002A24E136|nr:hypothetical protein [Mesorhizobium sp. VK9D]MDX8454916.1 hypothetical protein [Mesorhizobium sp. VK9D]